MTLPYRRLVVLVILGGLLFGVGLAGVSARATGPTAGLQDAQSTTPGPLPNDCHDVTAEGQTPPACCVFGYVYSEGRPGSGAQVTIQGPGGRSQIATTTGAASTDAYYRASLSDSPLVVASGDTVTVTAAFNGATAQTVYRVVAGGQQVDIVLPSSSAQTPIATINYIQPNPARLNSDTITFASSGADADGGSITAWEWTSSLEGALSTQSNFTLAAARLSVGTHAIALRVRDDEGQWSAPVTRSLRVDPYTEHFSTTIFRDSAKTTADWDIRDGAVRLPRQPGWSDQTAPAVAVDASGDTYVVWQDERNGPPGADPDIYAQKFDPSGNRLWPADTRVNSDRGDAAQENPVVVIDGSGDVVVIWQDRRSSSPGIYAQKLDTDGRKLWDGDQQVDDAAASAAVRPAAALDQGTGDIVVVWEDRRGGYADVYAQRLTAAGRRGWVGGDRRVSSNSGSSSIYGAGVGVDANGNAYVVWCDWLNSTGNIRAQKLSRLGTVLWTDFQINSHSSTGAGSFGPATIATTASGLSYVTWVQDPDSGPFDSWGTVYAQSIDANRNKQWMTEVRIDTGDTPVIQLLKNGSAFAVAWTECLIYNGYYGRDCHRHTVVQAYDTFGTAIWPAPVQIDASDSTGPELPALATDTNGGGRITWRAYHGRHLDVFVQRFASSGQKLWSKGGIQTNEDTGIASVDAALAVSSAGDATIAWWDGRHRIDEQMSIYARRLGPDGIPQWSHDRLVYLPEHSFYAQNNSEVAIAADAGGAIGIAWDTVSDSTTGRDVRAQMLHSDGTLLWPQNVRVNSDPSLEVRQYNPAVTMSAEGALYAAWRDDRGGLSGGSDIYVQALAASANKQWGGDRQVNKDTSPMFRSYPAAAFDSQTNGLYVVWQNAEYGSEIVLQRLDPEGFPLWPQDRALVGAYGAMPDLATANGYAFVVWSDLDGRILAQKVSAAGMMVWSGNTEIGRGEHPAIATTSDGKIYAVWQGWNSDNWDVFVQKLDTEGNLLWPAPVRMNSDAGWADQYNPDIGVDVAGNAYVTWGDYRRGSPDIWAQKLLPDGVKAWAGDVRVTPDLYLSTAEVYSLAINDTPGNVSWATLTVSSTVPTGSDVIYFLSNNGGQSWDEVASGVRHTFGLVGGDLRWRAVLASSNDPSQSPVLDWVQIEYASAGIASTNTPTPTPTSSNTPTQTPSMTPTPTATQTLTRTPLPTWTPSGPDIVVAPASISAAVPHGRSTTAILRISNRGIHPLTFAIKAQSGPAAAAASSGPSPALTMPKIDPDLLAALNAASDGRTTFFVHLAEQADLSGAEAITGWEARGEYVVSQLQDTARRTQSALLADLHNRHLIEAEAETHAFWIINAISVTGNRTTVDALAHRSDVAYLELSSVVQIPDLVPTAALVADEPVAWGVHTIRADDVWRDFGVNGAGIVVANIDTGVDYTHPALRRQYRGTATESHDYNWYDATGQYPNAPGDGTGHGTHTMGIMVGDDSAGHQIGVAPGAQWIAVRACTNNLCSQIDLLRAAQWILAPCPVGVEPLLEGSTSQSCSAAKRPRIVNNSWGGTGGNAWFEGAARAWRAAGIFPTCAAGKGGPAPASMYSPADYPECFAAGATNANDGIDPNSSRGPSTLTTEIKPNVSAPGVAIYSSLSGGGYGFLTGTSMASPHSAGAVALILAANPLLSVTQIEDLLTGTAVDLGQSGPDTDHGYGRIDAHTAVDAAKHVVPWLTFQPASGTAPSGGEQLITVTLDAATLDTGMHVANLTVTSSDPDADPVVVPVNLDVRDGLLDSGGKVYLPLLVKPSWADRAENHSYDTTCAEEDNVSAAILARQAARFRVVATHPTYDIGVDNCQPDFSGCNAPASGVAVAADSCTRLWDDGTNVVNGCAQPAPWRPYKMNISVGGSSGDFDYLVLYRKIQGAASWPQFLVLYEDGNLRLKPQPPAGRSDTCFGSSVIVGPAVDPAGKRPYADVQSVQVDPYALTLDLTYRNGGSAHMSLSVDRSSAIALVQGNYSPGLSSPFAIFRSMRVADGNADADRVQATARDWPIVNGWTILEDSRWFFHRTIRSTHNTSAPDILVEVIN